MYALQTSFRLAFYTTVPFSAWLARFGAILATRSTFPPCPFSFGTRCHWVACGLCPHLFFMFISSLRCHKATVYRYHGLYPWSRYSSLFPSHPTPPFDRPKLARHQLSHNGFIFPVYLCGYILYVSPLLFVAVTDYLSVYTYTNTPLLPLLLSLNSVLLLSSLLSPLLHKYTITPSIVKFPLFSSPCSR